MLDGHGDDIYRYNDLVKMNFSSNIYQHADLTALKEFMKGNFDLIANYPEPQPRSLERLIALKEGISPEAEAIYMIAAHFKNSASVIPQPTFNEYADACRQFNHIISYENNDEMTELPRDRVYWICNPNNPSGNVLMKGFMDYVVRRSPRYVFVVDQSYEAYTKEPLLQAREMIDVPNLLILHSLSKTYGVPGLRLGYVTGHPNTIQLLRQHRHPWAMNALSIEAGKFLLKKGLPAVGNLEEYLEETQRFRSNLREVKGVRVFETKTNYMLCELENATATDLKYHLIHEHGMLIRDCSNFYGLDNHFFRVSAQLPEENDALVAAIRDYLEASEK